MKATRDEVFTPVILTLETQAEVDGVFTLLNHALLAKAVELPDAWETLRGFRGPNASKLFDRVSDLISN